MSGGMGWRPGRTLAERSGPQAREPSPDAARHCWVVDPPGCPGRWPGLLAEWRRTERGWQGRVVYATAREGRPVLVETWVDAAVLVPA